jgi:hypothetical protein
VDLLKSASESFLNFGGALNATVTSAFGLGGVESLAGHGVREFRKGTAIVDFGLSPLDFQLIKDPGQFSDLLFVQFELVGQEPKRPPDPEPSATFEPISLVMRQETDPALTPMVMAVVLGVLRTLRVVGGMVRVAALLAP